MEGLQQNTILYAAVMLLAGIGIPLMATLNAGLGAKLQSPALAATILFFVGMTVSTLYMLIFEGLPKSIFRAEIPLYFYLGGIFVVFYVLSITWVAPSFGIANAVSFVLLGQLISMSVIDHFGLLGVSQNLITSQRVFGLLLMAIGVLLVVRK